MNQTKRWIGLVLALAMVFALAVPAAYADTTAQKVVVHKIVMNQGDLNNFNSKEYNPEKQITDIVGFFGDSAKEKSGVVFKFTLIKTATGGVPEQADVVPSFYTTGQTEPFTLPAGTYLMEEIHSESTYVGEDGELLTGMKAVPQEITLPFVNENGPVDTLHLYPKNTEDKPTMVKGFAEAFDADHNLTETERSYNIGDSVPYEIRVQVPANPKYGAFVWEDTMPDGLTFNNDLKIVLTIENEKTELTSVTHYEVNSDGINGFKVSLKPEGLAKIHSLTQKAQLTLTYSATLKEYQEVVDAAQINKIKLTYGNNTAALQSIESEGPKVYTGGKQFVKLDQNDNNLKLKDAKFVIYRLNDNKKKEFLRQVGPTEQTSLWKWVWEQAPEGQDFPEDTFQFISDDQGKFEVKGLKYGTYFLKEIKAPNGYALSQKDLEFKVEAGSYAGAEEKVTNIKITIPQTGGMGTVAFGVVGVVLMGGALLGMKRKKDEDEQ